MTRPSLAGIEPFSATPWSFQPWGDQNQNGDCAESILFDAHGETIAYGLPNADGALIAAAPALAAAVRDVLALHTDGGQSQGYTDDTPGGYGYIDHCCTECGSFGEYGKPWPCPTVRALAARFTMTPKEDR